VATAPDGHCTREINLGTARIHRADKHAVTMMIEYAPRAMAAGDDQCRAIVDIDIVNHQCERQHRIVGVRIKGPVLMPLQRPWYSV